jgi:predicted RND superfamily exporter protein
MKQDASFYARYGFRIILVAVFLAPVIVLGTRAALDSNSNDVRDWLPKEYEETARYAWFQQYFGNEEFVLCSWEGATVEDDRLELLTTKLQHFADNPESDRPPIFKRVISGRSLAEELAEPPLNLSLEEVQRRFKGTVFGPDGKQTCVVIILTPEAKRHLPYTVELIRNIAVEQCGIPADHFYMGGPPVANAAIDVASERSMTRSAALSGIVGLLIAWWCFRNLKLTFLICFSGVYSAGASLAIVPLLGSNMNAILLTMAPLVYVAATSGAIHLANYYRDAVHEKGRKGAAGRAIQHAWLPLGLATSTTAIGLLSLLYSELHPIESFGFYSAIGVVISLLVLFLVLPSVLEIWPPKDSSTRVATGEHHETGEMPLSPRWQRFARTVIANHALVSAVSIGLLAVFALGTRYVETSIKIMRFFSPETEIVHSYQWLETNMGDLVPMEVVLRIDEDCPLNTLERMELVAEVQQSIESLSDVSSAISVVNFASELPSRKNWPDVSWSARRGTINRNYSRKLERFVDTNYLALAADEQLWRISLRISSLHNVDYGEFIHTLEKQVQPLIEQQRAALRASASQRKQELTSQLDTLAAAETRLKQADGDAASQQLAGLAAQQKELKQQLGSLLNLRDQGINAVFTGMVPVVYKAQRSLLDGLLFGFGTDLLLVVVAIIVLMRHWSSGVLLACTSIFPPTIVFGVMGWLGIVVDIGTVMTPSVALGVTIDDVVHFILWFKRGIEKGLDRREAVMLAYEGCARAMYQSWGVIGLGLSMFALSAFTPTMRFGALMVSLLTAGLIGNLFFLPALLAGPLGEIVARAVRARMRRSQAKLQAEPAHGRSGELASAPDMLTHPDVRGIKS